MSALGELFVVLIYVILTIPIIIMIGLILVKRKKIKTKYFIYLLVSSIPLIFFSYSQYNNHRQAELRYVGTYNLTDYPNCKTCILKLKKNNTYSVLKRNVEIEKGDWNFRSGGDYWIVDIGKFGQLGTGKYKYSKSKNNFDQ
ncbi:hypothetical protein AB9K26_07245 [Psychroserpens sp. XS_ASV72]|uniref:hypothetical protein n=1 Tax=Psychroserpens sp. XS_ASV72 TaxID=3241293 RepID=UPI003512530E